MTHVCFVLLLMNIIKEIEMKRLTAIRILYEIGEPNLKLYTNRNDGYWYFVYDDGKIFLDESVMTPRLRDMSLDKWVAIGKKFMRSVKQLHQ